MMKIGKVSISPGFFLLLAIFILLDRENLCLYIFLAILPHELSHYLLIRFYGGKVSEINFNIIGIEIKTKNFRIISYMSEILICLAGPFINILLALLFSVIGKVWGSGDSYIFAGINLALGLFNLLPVRGLDGGQALSFLLEWLFGAGSTLPGILTVLISVVFVIFGIRVFAVTGFNFTMLAAGLWILLKPVRGLEKGKNKGYNRFEPNNLKLKNN